MRPSLHLYNTMTQKVEPFVKENGVVGLYVCGPTTYAKSHIGHAKSYITFDLIRRFLEMSGKEVNHTMSLTDVADEIVKKASAEGVDESALSREYEDAFLDDMKRLGNLAPGNLPRVSDHIPQIIGYITKLEDKGMLNSKDGKLYLDIEKDDYGFLTHTNLDDVITQGEENLGTIDIMTWDTVSPGQKWDSPWGKGRPGWHVQCYTFIKEHVGFPVDIHGGGMDLVFPHHESEDIIARKLEEGETCSWWVHNGLILAGRDKMSKSKGNIVELHQLLNRYGPDAVRMFVLSKHYRETSLYTPPEILKWEEQAEAFYVAIGDSIEQWKAAGTPEPKGWANDVMREIFEDIADDLHTDRAVERLVQSCDRIREGCTAEEAGAFLNLIRGSSRLMGLFQDIPNRS